jgi:hypothetical protein
VSYADKNEKALAFGNAHLRQISGRAKILRGEYEELRDNGVVLTGGKVPERYKGMTLDERRQAKLDELMWEINLLEEEARGLIEAIEDLKGVLEPSDLDEVWVRILSRHHRGQIASYTGTNPLSFVEE